MQNQYGSWSVGPNVSWNIFQAGKTVYNVKLQEALTREAGVNWEDAVLTAIKEVEDALVSAEKERARIEHLNRMVENYRKAFELSRELYTQGEIEFIDLLEAQRSMLSSAQNQVLSRKDFIGYIIMLYKSLGGGWTEADVADEPKIWSGYFSILSAIIRSAQQLLKSELYSFCNFTSKTRINLYIF